MFVCVCVCGGGGGGGRVATHVHHFDYNVLPCVTTQILDLPLACLPYLSKTV